MTDPISEPVPEAIQQDLDAMADEVARRIREKQEEGSS